MRVLTLEKAQQDEFGGLNMHVSNAASEGLTRHVSDVGFSNRTEERLLSHRIEFIYQIVSKTEEELMASGYFGRKVVDELREVLRAMDLALGLELTEELKNALGIPLNAEVILSKKVRRPPRRKLPSRDALLKQFNLICYRLKNYDAIANGEMPLSPPRNKKK